MTNFKIRQTKTGIFYAEIENTLQFWVLGHYKEDKYISAVKDFLKERDLKDDIVEISITVN